MKVRALDENKDWTFGAGLQNYKTDEDAISQNVKTKLNSFLGDCFFDTEEGIDWFTLWDTGRLDDLLESIQNKILSVEGITGLNSFDYELVNRKLKVSYDVQTVFSQSYQDTFEA